MGIKGLLPRLNSITYSMDLKELKGECVAVDASCLVSVVLSSLGRDVCAGFECAQLLRTIVAQPPTHACLLVPGSQYNKMPGATSSIT